MFNWQFSNKKQTNICLTIPIASATQKRQKCVQWFTLTTTMFHYEYFALRDGCHTQHSQHELTKFTKYRFVSRTPHFLKFEKDLVPLSIAAHTVHAMMLIHVCRLTTDIMSQRNSICVLALAYISTYHLILGITEQGVITSIMNAYTTLPVESTFVTLYSGN